MYCFTVCVYHQYVQSFRFDDLLLEHRDIGITNKSYNECGTILFYDKYCEGIID